jgi:hypothetical protein
MTFCEERVEFALASVTAHEEKWWVVDTVSCPFNPSPQIHGYSSNFANNVP